MQGQGTVPCPIGEPSPVPLITGGGLSGAEILVDRFAIGMA